MDDLPDALRAVYYQPRSAEVYNTLGTLLQALGVEYDAVTGIPHHDPGTMETNVEGVFIAGVLSAGFNANKVFIENGRGHGDLIVRHVAGKLAG